VTDGHRVQVARRQGPPRVRSYGSAVAVDAPTLVEIRRWPATCDPEQAGLALGVSRSTVYEALRRGDFPGRAIRVGGRWRVITASLVELLEAK
jgi:excisionase family DNA binding protein